MPYTLNRLFSGESFDAVYSRTRKALADHGFGGLTEIDVATTMKKKLDVDMPPTSSSARTTRRWHIRPSAWNLVLAQCCLATS